MLSDDKLKERISLITRYFWLEDLFKIGNELNLEYFKKYSSYWETNQYQAATEIARNIDDNKLIELCKKHVPKYGLSLGGFHGRYYTATTTGELTLESSWDFIRRNARKALNKWKDQAYGTLQALVNKNGKAAYFELIDEIEKVLGYDFTPSYLLGRLGPLNLVFKTGSNKYPEWTMPSEIIPVVQEELSQFKRPAHPPRPRHAASDTLLKQVRDADSLVSQVVEARRELNMIFDARFKIRFLRQDEKAVNDLRKPCSSEDEFSNRILTLSLIIDEVETESASKLVNAKLEPGSINLLDGILKEYSPDYEKSAIENLRMIKVLRNKKYPVHPDDAEYLDALHYFGFDGFPPDWQKLWETVLGKYLETLTTLARNLAQGQK